MLCLVEAHDHRERFYRRLIPLIHACRLWSDANCRCPFSLRLRVEWSFAYRNTLTVSSSAQLWNSGRFKAKDLNTSTATHRVMHVCKCWLTKWNTSGISGLPVSCPFKYDHKAQIRKRVSLLTVFSFESNFSSSLNITRACSAVSHIYFEMLVFAFLDRWLPSIDTVCCTRWWELSERLYCPALSTTSNVDSTSTVPLWSI